MHHDLIIRNGTVVDGTGAPEQRTDVAVDGEQLIVVGADLPKQQIDLNGDRSFVELERCGDGLDDVIIGAPQVYISPNSDVGQSYVLFNPGVSTPLVIFAQTIGGPSPGYPRLALNLNCRNAHSRSILFLILELVAWVLSRAMMCRAWKSNCSSDCDDLIVEHMIRNIATVCPCPHRLHIGPLSSTRRRRPAT